MAKQRQCLEKLEEFAETRLGDSGWLADPRRSRLNAKCDIVTVVADSRKEVIKKGIKLGRKVKKQIKDF